MRDIYQCHECGFMSTDRKLFVSTHGELHCENCAEREHGTVGGFAEKPKEANND
jgi:hypothetical protein